MKNACGIYLDNHATTAVAPDIIAGLAELLGSHVGNASSTDHAHGQWAQSLVEEARQTIGAAFRGNPAGIIFTSGATEASNLILRSLIAQKPRGIIVCSAVEHPSVLETARDVAAHIGGELRIVDVDGRGRIDLDQIREKAKGAVIGCFMAANHEMGAVYPSARIGAILKEAGAQFLCDATQAVGKVPLDLGKSHIDYLVLSGHKVHALQGVGAIVCPVAKPSILPSMTGGAQQNGKRPGTYNLPGIWSLGRAISAASATLTSATAQMGALRDLLWERLQTHCDGLELTGDPGCRLANNLHFCVRGVMNSMIIERLRGSLSVSTGSACSSGAIEPSRVLKAMRLPHDLIGGAIRIGLSRYTTATEIDEAAALLVAAINSIRELARVPVR